MTAKIKEILKIKNLVLIFFFYTIFAYLPTSRPGDQYVWLFGFLLMLIYGIWNIIHYHVKIKIDLGFVWYLFFTLFCILSIFWSKNIDYTIEYLIYFFPFLIIVPLFLSTYVNNEKDIYLLLRIIVWAGVFAAIRFLIYTDWNYANINGSFYRGAFGALLDDVTNYNSYTSHLCIICIVSAFLYFSKRERLYLIPFLFLTAVLVFAGSRKNLIVIPVISLVLVVFSKSDITMKIKIICVFLIILCVGIYLLMNLNALANIKKSIIDMFYGLFDSDYNIDYSTESRIYLISEAKKVFSQNFLIGVGFNNFKYYNTLQLYAHNNYMELLSTLGLVGFCLYYIIYVYIIFGSLKIFRKTKDNIFIFIVAISIGFMIQEYGGITFYFRERMILLLFIINIYCLKTNKYKKIIIENASLPLFQRSNIVNQ